MTLATKGRNCAHACCPAALLFHRSLTTPPDACCLLPMRAVQIARRRRAHQEAHPDAQIISLGIGDTTEPLPQFIADAMAKAAAGLATREGYSGYASAPSLLGGPPAPTRCCSCALSSFTLCICAFLVHSQLHEQSDAYCY